MRLVQEQHKQQECHHYQERQMQQIQLTLYQVSRYAACCIIATFFIFIAGFYWGKKSITEVVLEEVSKHLLADKIRAALYTTQEHNYNQEQAKEQMEHCMYSLHFGMFPTRKMAQTCVEKLKLLDCPGHIQQRLSATAQGKQYTWYEVVTPAGKTHAEIKALQTRIEKNINQQQHIQAYIQTHSIDT